MLNGLTTNIDDDKKFKEFKEKIKILGKKLEESHEKFMRENPNLITPFYCGSQYIDWVGRNCDNCQMGYDENHGKYKCHIQGAFDHASISDGYINKDIFIESGGNLEDMKYSWKCKKIKYH